MLLITPKFIDKIRGFKYNLRLRRFSRVNSGNIFIEHACLLEIHSKKGGLSHKTVYAGILFKTEIDDIPYGKIRWYKSPKDFLKVVSNSKYEERITFNENIYFQDEGKFEDNLRSIILAMPSNVYIELSEKADDILSYLKGNAINKQF